MKMTLALGSLLLFALAAGAKEAVTYTQGAMKNPVQRKAVLLTTPESQKFNQGIENSVGSENINEIYSISADMLPELML